MAIVLASGSPRRRELLEMLGLKDLIVCPAQGEERAAPGLAPGELVIALAGAKAAEVAAQFGPDDLILAADTVVALPGRILGKPHSEAEAAEMLRALSGRSHFVYTGLVLRRGECILVEMEETKVFFRPLSDREIRAYIATGEPMDKAGSYGIQGKGSLFVEGLEGDYFNVMGLPLCRLGKMLKEMGVELL